jgi:hypothetical protein
MNNIKEVENNVRAGEMHPTNAASYLLKMWKE